MVDEALMILSGGTDLTIDANGPDPLVIMLADALRVDLPQDPIDLEFAAVGIRGCDGVNGTSLPAEAVASATMAAGMPVVISRATGQMIAADAAFKPTAFVAGLLSADVVAGFVGSAATSRLSLADWSAATGAAQLTPGMPYFLAVGGGLTAVPPTSGCVVLIGQALDAATLLISHELPIQL